MMKDVLPILGIAFGLGMVIYAFFMIGRSTSFTITNMKRHNDTDWIARVHFKRGSKTWWIPVRSDGTIWRDATTGERVHPNVETALQDQHIIAQWLEEKLP